MSHSATQYSKIDGYDAMNTNKRFGEEYHDGKRRMYEMCMVFRFKTSKSVRYEEHGSVDDRPTGEIQPETEEKNQMQMWKQRREAILKSLQNPNYGLNIFCYYSRDRDDIVVKIGASAQKLRETAARMRYKLQLKKQYLNAYAEYRHDFPGRRELNFADRRVISHIYKTHTEDDFPHSDAIFKTLDKIYLIHHIITSKDKDCAGINIGHLLHQGDLRAYFPLHEIGPLSDLKHEATAWLLMPEEQANKLRDYFGDRIAYYFLFMSFYLKWMIPIAVVGLCTQVIDCWWTTPDNITAIPFCILMSVWSTFLPYFWRRQEAKYAIGWGTLDMVEQLQPCRPEHDGEPRINPVTGQVEPFYPKEKRLWQYLFSFAVMSVVGFAVVFSILLLGYWRHTLKGMTMGGIFTWQFLVACYVEIMNYLLTELSRWLTTRENHRTQQEHEGWMLGKVMLFKFLCTYSILYYTAFFKHASQLFNTQMECMKPSDGAEPDCFLDLKCQLAVFVFFRLTVMNIFEYFKPKLKFWWNTNKNNRGHYMRNVRNQLSGHSLLELDDMSNTEQQARRQKYDQFTNFDEILISHGFATFFAVTAPWVCAATLVGTAVEVYLDSRSLMDNYQRPIPTRARSNEPWSTAFDIYGLLAASTNIFLLIFSSNQYETWTYTEKLLLFIYLEHMIIIARVLLKLVFPEVPRNVELLQLKQDNIVHRCLENIKVEQNQDFSMFRDPQKDGGIEVFEQDILERDDEVMEPELKISESFQSMFHGVKEESHKWLGRS